MSSLPGAALAAGLALRGLALCDLRPALAALPPADLAAAGRAVALSQWHQAHRFCPRCGAPAAPVEGGLKRQCAADAKHRLYPRTDPVVIMLVESPDGSRALLGRSKKVPADMLTCLAGFVDQVRAAAAARRREASRANERAALPPRPLQPTALRCPACAARRGSRSRRRWRGRC